MDSEEDRIPEEVGDEVGYGEFLDIMAKSRSFRTY
jgi:hypothetical protein